MGYLNTLAFLPFLLLFGGENEPTRQPMAWRVPTHETPVPFLLLGYEPRFDRSRGSDLENEPTRQPMAWQVPTHEMICSFLASRL